MRFTGRVIDLMDHWIFVLYTGPYAGRPTIKAWRASQKKIEELELKLQKAIDDAR